MVSKLVKSGVGLAIVAVIMGFTNPKQEAYVDYASEKLVDRAEELVCKEIGYCKLGKPPILVQNTLIKPAIQAATKRQNLGIFSIYTTEFPSVRTFKTLGIFGNFFTYSDKS
jgi:hypothetical protein